MTTLDVPPDSLTSPGEDLRVGIDPATEPELIGEAEVRGRLVTVAYRGGMLHGDPELTTRLIRVSGRFPDTALEFLSALRLVGGRCRLDPATQD
jgi:hypothetical protein